MVALKPLHDEARIKRVVVSTYQSVSGAGKEGMDELWDQTKGVFVLGAPEPKNFPKQIAFNVIPYIGDVPATTATPTKKPRCGTRPTRSSTRPSS